MLFRSEAKAAVKVSENGRFFYTCDMNELSAALDSYVQNGDLVLLKGSRGCALEKLCPVLEGAVASKGGACLPEEAHVP